MENFNRDSLATCLSSAGDGVEDKLWCSRLWWCTENTEVWH